MDRYLINTTDYVMEETHTIHRHFLLFSLDHLTKGDIAERLFFRLFVAKRNNGHVNFNKAQYSF